MTSSEWLVMEANFLAVNRHLTVSLHCITHVRYSAGKLQTLTLNTHFPSMLWRFCGEPDLALQMGDLEISTGNYLMGDQLERLERWWCHLSWRDPGSDLLESVEFTR